MVGGGGVLTLAPPHLPSLLPIQAIKIPVSMHVPSALLAGPGQGSLGARAEARASTRTSKDISVALLLPFPASEGPISACTLSWS